MKQAQCKLTLGKQQMISLKDKHGKVIKCRDKMTKRVEEYYKELESAWRMQTSTNDASNPLNKVWGIRRLSQPIYRSPLKSNRLLLGPFLTSPENIQMRS